MALYWIGIEVEAVRTAWDAEVAPYTGYTQQGWTLTTDESVGVELQSPPLLWPDARAEVTHVLHAWRDAPSVLSHKAGFHVHLSWPGITPTQFPTLLTGYYAHQDLLRWLIRPLALREENWCAPVNLDVIDRTQNRIDSRWALPPSRFYALNCWGAFVRHGTIEWRIFNGTKNARKALAYIDLAVACTDAWLTATPLPSTVPDFLAWITRTLPPDSASFWRHRAAESQTLRGGDVSPWSPDALTREYA
jgi:hypothetical protein